MVMDIAWPMLVAVLAWWVGTGIILWLDRQGQAVVRIGLLVWTGLFALSLYGAWVSMESASSTNAYMGFFAAIGMWGWHELVFLSGHLTGPRRVALSLGAKGWQRFRQAFAAVLWHELALVANALVLVVMQGTQTNHVALCTFGLLWCMRLIAKLNLFVGVPLVGANYLPAHLQYLASYFHVARVGWWYRFTMAMATAGWVSLIWQTSSAHPADFTGWVLLCSLFGLGILEMLIMVLPWPLQNLWGWMVRMPDPT
ncbi:MAG: hypothetical protein RL307_564 [Pseudomonadota bacterium]|jgi:putative photosynthetic complex assembly protein 2